MRVLLDTNILISYLLAPGSDSAVARIVAAGVLGKYILLLPEALLAELEATVSAKEYLVDRIAPEDVWELADILSTVSEMIGRIKDRIPAVTRDPKDDYLLAYALVGQADFLVTGDQDLLVLQQVEGVRIVTPHDFAQLIETV